MLTCNRIRRHVSKLLVFCDRCSRIIGQLIIYIVKNQGRQFSSQSMSTAVKHGSAEAPNLIITLRKLVIKAQPTANQRVTVAIRTCSSEASDSSNEEQNTSVDRDLAEWSKSESDRVFEISKSKSIKNGVACFFGESISVGIHVKRFIISVLIVGETEFPAQSKSRRVLTEYYISQNKIKGLFNQKCTFQSQSDSAVLTWEAKLEYDNQRQQEYQDRSLDDFKDIEPRLEAEIQKQLLGRKTYSPAVKGELRRQRSSIYFRDNRDRGDMISQSPHKLTMDTNETHVKTKKKLKLLSPVKNKKLQSIIFREFKRESIQQKEPILLQKQKKVQNIRPVLTSRQFSTKSLHVKRTTKCQKQKHECLRPKKKQKFYEKISLKSLLYMSLIGILGGVAAAQF